MSWFYLTLGVCSQCGTPGRVFRRGRRCEACAAKRDPLRNARERAAKSHAKRKSENIPLTK